MVEPDGQQMPPPNRDNRGVALWLFVEGLKLYPELDDELARIAPSLGLSEAVADAMADAILANPDTDLTPEWMREVTGAPGPDADEAAMHEWKMAFWDAHKQKREEANRNQGEPS